MSADTSQTKQLSASTHDQTSGNAGPELTASDQRAPGTEIRAAEEQEAREAAEGATTREAETAAARVADAAAMAMARELQSFAEAAETRVQRHRDHIADAPPGTFEYSSTRAEH